MFKFAKSGSALFQFLSWLFVATLFCDCANLLGLVQGVVPVHDDFDAARTHNGDVSVTGCAAAGLVVIDQDSPSLEPQLLRLECESLFTPLDDQIEVHDAPPQAGQMHILFRSLLI